MRTGTLGTAVGVSFTCHICLETFESNKKKKKKKYYPFRKSLLYEAEIKADFI